jgi:hypothetical protein
MHKIEVELTEEEAAKLRTLMESGDTAAIEKEVERIEQLVAVRDIAKELRMKLMRDVILNAHHYLHEGDEGRDRAMMLLCPTAALLEGETPPLDVLTALFDALNKGNAEREKASCGGTA